MAQEWWLLDALGWSWSSSCTGAPVDCVAWSKKRKIKGGLKPACHFIDDVFSIHRINIGKDTRAMMVNLTTPLVDKDGELVMSFLRTSYTYHKSLMFSGVDTN